MLRSLNRTVFNSRKCIKSYFNPNSLCFSGIARFNNKFASILRSSSRIKFSVNSGNSSLLRSLCTKESDTEDDIDGEEYFDMEGIDIVETSEQTYLEQMMNLLYLDVKNDDLLNSITNSDSIDQLYETLEQHLEEFTKIHLVQTVLLHWALSKKESSDSKLNLDRPIVQGFLEKIKQMSSKMTPDEITCCLMYLHKCGIDVKKPLMQELVEIFLAKSQNEDISLTALSRFIVTVNESVGLYSVYASLPIAGLISEKLKNLRTDEELRLVTICFNNLHYLTTAEMLEKYQEKVCEYMDSKNHREISTKCILKVINFLNYPHWSHHNSSLIRKLALLLKDRINTFQERELAAIYKIIEGQLEPSVLIPEISAQSQKLLDEKVTPYLLTCSLFTNVPEKREEFTKAAEKLIKNYKEEPNFPILFKVLRLLKTSDLKTINEFWNCVVDFIMCDTEEQQPYRLIRHIHRYMHFNNNLGGTYRHSKFERTLISLIINEIQNGISGYIPSKFARLVAFIIAYGYVNRDLTNKIVAMSEQFSIYDTLHLSRGVQIAQEMRFRRRMPDDVASYFMAIYNVIDGCIERSLKNARHLELNDINFLIRTYNNKRSTRRSELFSRLVEKYETNDCPLDSRLIRDVTYNLNSANYRSNRILEKALHYIDENVDAVGGDTVEKVLFCCYNLGFSNENYDDILDKCAKIIMRDFKYMSGLSIVQACLALCYFKTLPESLINRVFNIDFIWHLEQEIKFCYSKVTYPERVLNQVMKLNRAVCLDYPEAQVPWFQQNYLEAQMSKLPIIRDQFHVECKQLLLEIVKDEKLIRMNHVTPYGYRIDFVLHRDTRQRKFISPPSSSGDAVENVSKIGVLLLKSDAFCENESTIMKGHESLRQRHLEILGYKVVYVKYNVWNSMFMNLPGAKSDYMKELLQIG